MSKDMKVLEDMFDYVRQLRRHTDGRYGLHIRISSLEKQFQQERYRFQAASALRPLITKYGAVLFALPNTDLVLITKDASIDVIDTQLNLIRKNMKDASLIAGLDPIQGISDAFTSWFDLETQYDAFLEYIKNISHRIRKGDKFDAPKTSKLDDGVKAAEGLMAAYEALKKPAKMVRMVPIKAPDKETGAHPYDAELMYKIVRELAFVDVSSLLRRQSIKAIIGTEDGQAIMVHKCVPETAVFDALLEGPVYGRNKWLEGYLSEFLAERLLSTQPTIEEDGSLAVSLQVTCSSIFSKAFAAFDKPLTSSAKNKVVMEFTVADVLAHYGDYEQILEKLDILGYRTSVRGIDLRALSWIDHQSLQANFVKVMMPKQAEKEWLSAGLQVALKDRIQKIGVARVILEGCNTPGHIATGKKLGITLFQGDVVSPMQVHS